MLVKPRYGQTTAFMVHDEVEVQTSKCGGYIDVIPFIVFILAKLEGHCAG